MIKKVFNFIASALMDMIMVKFNIYEVQHLNSKPSHQPPFRKFWLSAIIIRWQCKKNIGY